MSVGADVADALHVGWKFFGFPSRSPQQKPLVWQPPRGIEEESVDPGFTVRQAVAEKSQLGFESRDRLDRKMMVRIERVVNRHAIARANGAVSLHDGSATAIGKNNVVARNSLAQMMGGVRSYFVQCCGSIDVPIGAARPRGRFHHCAFEFPVENANAAGFDKKIRGANRLFKRALPSFRGRGIDNYLGPFRIQNIAVALPLECIWLKENNLMSERGKRLQDAAVIGGGAIPIR